MFNNFDLSLGRQDLTLSDLYDRDASVRDQLCFPEIEGGFNNLTERFVPRSVRVIFSLGPLFVPPHLPTFPDTIAVLEHLNVNFERSMPNLDPTRSMTEMLSRYGDELADFCKGLPSISFEAKIILRMLKDAKIFLSSNPDLCLVQADKGKVTVLMCRKSYHLKMSKWVDSCISKGVYVPFQGNLSHRLRAMRSGFNRLQRQFLDLYKSSHTKRLFPYRFIKEFQTLASGDVVMPYLYGTVKVHKPEHPMRPICATRNFYTHPIQGLVAYFLGGVLRPHISTHNVYDINDVVRELYTLPICHGYVFAKFDVVDMYTSMDRGRIFSYLEDLCNDSNFISAMPIPVKLLLSAVNYSFHNACVLTYDSEVYEQRRGLPQGACDSGLLATVYLDYLLSLHNTSLFVNHKVVYWWKYMDDFLLYIPENYITSFQSVFEELTGLQLTLENEVMSEGGFFMSFLDIGIIRLNTCLKTFTYVKPIASKRILHYNSNMSPHHRKATLTTFLRKILTRTHNHYLITDVMSLERKAVNNGYPYLYISKLFVPVIIMAMTSLTNSTLPFHMCIGDVAERLDILHRVVSQYPHFTTVGLHFGKSSILSPIRCNYTDRGIGGSISMPYYCEEVCSFIKRISDEYDLLPTIYRKGRTLLSHLDMCLADKIPCVTRQSKNINSGIVFCAGCKRAFFVSSESQVDSMLETLTNDTNSAIFKHVTHTGHTICNVVHRLGSIGKLTLSMRLALYKALYVVLGYEVESDSVIGIIPRYLYRYVRVLFRHFASTNSGYLVGDRLSILPMPNILPLVGGTLSPTYSPGPNIIPNNLCEVSSTIAETSNNVCEVSSTIVESTNNVTNNNINIDSISNTILRNTVEILNVEIITPGSTTDSICGAVGGSDDVEAHNVISSGVTSLVESNTFEAISPSISGVVEPYGEVSFHLATGEDDLMLAFDQCMDQQSNNVPECVVPNSGDVAVTTAAVATRNMDEFSPVDIRCHESPCGVSHVTLDY